MWKWIAIGVLVGARLVYPCADEYKKIAEESRSREQIFSDAIRDAPYGDDTARLIYADWLDEQGHWQGEFIRIEVELWRMREGTHPHGLGPWDPQYKKLRERAVALAIENNLARPATHKGLIESYSPIVGGKPHFIHDLIWDTLPKAGSDSIPSGVRVLRAELWADEQAGFARLLTHPEFSSLRELHWSLDGQPPSALSRPGFAATHLKALVLRRATNPADISKSPHLKELQYLELDRTNVTAADLRKILTSAHLPSLHSLSLKEIALRVDVLHALRTHAPKDGWELIELSDFYYSGGEAGALGELLESDKGPRQLVIHQAPEFMKDLFGKEKKFSRLERVSLSAWEPATYLDDLLQTEMPNLRELHLSNPTGNKYPAGFLNAARARFPKLEKVTLSEGMETLKFYWVDGEWRRGHDSRDRHHSGIHHFGRAYSE